MTNEHLDQLKEIRQIMERSSRFISLSGLSGVWAGLTALAGVAIVWCSANGAMGAEMIAEYSREDRALYYLLVFAGVFVAAIVGGMFFTQRKARRDGIAIWSRQTQRLLWNLGIPLAVGAAFCVLLVLAGTWALVASASLVFYGMALLNASVYTIKDIRYLGYAEVALGLIAGGVGLYYPGYGLWFWALGFGGLHIIYGVVLYLKYER